LTKLILRELSVSFNVLQSVVTIAPALAHLEAGLSVDTTVSHVCGLLSGVSSLRHIALWAEKVVAEKWDAPGNLIAPHSSLPALLLLPLIQHVELRVPLSLHDASMNDAFEQAHWPPRLEVLILDDVDELTDEVSKLAVLIVFYGFFSYVCSSYRCPDVVVVVVVGSFFKLWKRSALAGNYR
jgi:hypothetical protein